MNAKDKDKLIKHRTYLVDNVNIDGLLTHLLTTKTITLRTKATIENAGSVYTQIEKLLDFLTRGGPNAYYQFCEALKENNQEYIVIHLENKTADVELKLVHEEKDTDEFIQLVEVPNPQLPTKRYYSMSNLHPSNRNGIETRYVLKHFISVPENSSRQNLDFIPTKLSKRELIDTYNPGDISSSKKQRFMDDSNLQDDYNSHSKISEIIVTKVKRKFYFDHYKKAYVMNSIPRGQALIINISQIDGMKPRNGSDIDTLNLRALLQQLHFEVTVYDGEKMTAMNIDRKVYEFAHLEEHKSANAAVVCLLSHGDDGHIFGSDGQQLELNKIFTYFDNANCPSLQDKPKIFIIQACRGANVDHRTKMGDLTPPVDEADGPHTFSSASSLRWAPSKSDMIICYPTQQGYRAWRNREQGSWFIQAIVKVFMQYACCEDICAMMNRVNNMVSQMVSVCANENINGTMQMSEFESSLRKPYLFFFPGIGSKPWHQF